jgi:hypothetical protein
MARALYFLNAHPIGDKNRMQTMARYFRWQIGKKFISAPIIHDWINGSKLIVAPGMTGATGNS